MATQDYCQYLSEKGSGCNLRNSLLSKAEVRVKCSITDLAVMCIDAYNALFKAQGLMRENSTDAFLWITESANQFENLQETDNALHIIVRGIDFAISNNLIDKSYELFRYGRSMYEAGLSRADPSLKNPKIKHDLVQAGEAMIAKARQLKEGSDVADMQAELKVAILGGVQLKRPETEEEEMQVVIIDGRSLYEKKAEEYREGADKYLSSGMTTNAITFACMAALAELMLGRPKEGLVYLTKFVAESGREKERIQENVCFKWTKVVFRALVERDSEAIQEANVMFYSIAWSFKDDREFARRVMDSVQRRLSL